MGWVEKSSFPGNRIAIGVEATLILTCLEMGRESHKSVIGAVPLEEKIVKILLAQQMFIHFISNLIQ